MADGDPWSIDTGDDPTTDDPNIRMIDGIPWMLQQDPATGQWFYTPVPTGYTPGGTDIQYGQQIPNQPFYHTPDWYVNQGKSVYPEYQTGRQWQPVQMPSTPQFNYPSLMGGGGGGGPSYMQYDPFSQQLQAAQLQESIRQANLTAGYNRVGQLNDVLSNPANVFASWFQARGQVPPYNSQLANILNIPNGGNPWFGAMPDMGQTPLPPNIPTPQAPQAIPTAAKGGTFIPAEPTVAIGMNSGQPLFTFNENAPQQTEKVKITPQVPSFAEGGTAFSIPPGPYGSTPLPPFPAPIQDFYDRGGPQFPWLTQLGQGQGLQYPNMSQAAHGMPTPSLQSLNRMLPSEQQGLFSMYNTLFGISPEDVVASSRYGFNNLRSATPALQRLQ